MRKSLPRRLLCFIIPYFGNLPNTMDAFLKTIEYNPNYYWMLLTDCKTDYDYPENVIVRYCSFSQIKERIQQCFDFEISLPVPKKLCDFKPAYGYIFNEELEGFDFWGYCDIDQFFGNLSNWLTREYLEQFDRVFGLGHMTIYRNCHEMNTLFMNKDKRSNLILSSYQEVFQRPENQTFDEMAPNKVNINYLAKQAEIRQSNDCLAVDIVPFRSVFSKSFYYPKELRWSESENLDGFILLWDKGVLFTVEDKNRKIIKDSVLYAHIQKRNLSFSRFIEDCSAFVITPNRIISLHGEIGDKLLLSYLRKQRFRSKIHIDEIMHWKSEKSRLFKHRLKKLFAIIRNS